MEFTFSHQNLTAALVAAIKEELICMAHSNNNDLPSTVKSLDEVSQYCDHNMLGGVNLLCHLLDIEKTSDILEAAQSQIEAWLKDGNLQKEAFKNEPPKKERREPATATKPRKKSSATEYKEALYALHKAGRKKGK